MPYATARVLLLSLPLRSSARPPAAAAAGPGRLVPAAAGAARRTARTFYAEGAPGTALQDTVSVTNPGGSPSPYGCAAPTAPLRRHRRDRSRHGRGRLRRHPAPRTRCGSSGPHPRRRALHGDRPGGRRARRPRRPRSWCAARTAARAAVRLQLRVGGPALSALTVEHVAVARRPHHLRTGQSRHHGPHPAPRRARRRRLRRASWTAPRAPCPSNSCPAAASRSHEPWPDPPALDAVDVRLTVTAEGGAHGTATASDMVRAVGGGGGGRWRLAAVGALLAVRRTAYGVDGPAGTGTGADGRAARTARVRTAELTGAVT